MTGFDESGAVESVDFDYDAVDIALAQSCPESCGHPNRTTTPSVKAAYQLGYEAAWAVFRELLKWQIQTVPVNNSGIEIRGTIVPWQVLPYLRCKSLTDIAAGIGRDKQSVGRWSDDFKRRFPGVYAAGRRNGV